MTRKEAEKEAAALNKKKPQWFCPLTNDMCRPDCVNFSVAYVDSDVESKDGKRKSLTLHVVDDEDFYVTGFFCTNSMFMPSMSCGH